MGLLVTLILGGFIGWLASLVTHRDAEQNWLENILVGIVGALLGSFVGSLITGNGADANFLIGFEVGDIFWAFLGAVALCLALNYFKKSRNTLR